MEDVQHCTGVRGGLEVSRHADKKDNRLISIHLRFQLVVEE